MKGRLIALSSAAVLAVYTAGYARTRSAAEMLEAEAQRPPMPRPGSVDRTPIPATPHDPVLVAAAAVSAPAVAPPARGVVDEPIDKSRRNPEATPEKRAVRALADLAASVAAAPSRAAAPMPAPPSAVAPLAPQVPIAAVTSESGPAPVPVAPAAPVAQAPVAPAAPAPPAVPTGPKWKDGHYTGWGTSRHGDLQATVFIESGRIATASISQCLTRYPCDWISKLPPQVIQRQSAEVDYVSGATESANAFYYAVLQALSKAAGSQ